MVEDILELVVWIILGTQHLETTLELINVQSKTLKHEHTLAIMEQRKSLH